MEAEQILAQLNFTGWQAALVDGTTPLQHVETVVSKLRENGVPEEEILPQVTQNLFGLQNEAFPPFGGIPFQQ